MTTTKNHYEVLGVRPDASKAEIDAAWRRAVSFWHPDRNKSVEAQSRLVEVNRARDVLQNEVKRRQYDRSMGFAGGWHPRMDRPSDVNEVARARRARQASQSKKKRTSGRRGKKTSAADQAGKEKSSEVLMQPGQPGDFRTVTIFDRRPAFTRFVLVPVGVTAIFLAALITVLLT